MPISPDETLILTAADHSWQIRHPGDRLTALGELHLGDQLAWHGATCHLGDTSDEIALLEDARGTRKGQQLVVTVHGHLPFGSQPIFHHATRCADGYLRVTTDLRLRPHTRLRGDVEIGTMRLADDWQSWRTLQADVTGRIFLSDKQPLDEPMEWPAPPLALILERSDGARIEIGTGSDLWRWADGIEGAPGPPRWQLLREDDTWLLRRIIATFPEAEDTTARSYRFSWYAAWRQADDDEPLSEPEQLLPWEAAGRLEPDAVAAIPDGACVAIDAGTLHWPPELLHSGDACPCFANRATGKRLRKAIRQLEALRDRSFTVLLQGLRPAVCRNGSHVGRPGDRPHWDINGLLDFIAWGQQVLGPERPLRWDPADLRTPSMHSLTRHGEATFSEA